MALSTTTQLIALAFHHNNIELKKVEWFLQYTDTVITEGILRYLFVHKLVLGLIPLMGLLHPLDNWISRFLLKKKIKTLHQDKM
jgi:hypothetical protein